MVLLSSLAPSGPMWLKPKVFNIFTQVDVNNCAVALKSSSKLLRTFIMNIGVGQVESIEDVVAFESSADNVETFVSNLVFIYDAF